MKKKVLTIVGGLLLAGMFVAGTFYLNQVEKQVTADQFDQQKTVAVIP